MGGMLFDALGHEPQPAGRPDKVIQQILRHANVTTTMNIYVKMVSQDSAVAMKTLEA
jgi:integrase